MLRSNILVVVVDGLRASALGAYGNTTYPTPSLDQFAAESMLFDSCFAPSSELSAVYRAMWQSCHPARTLDAISSKNARSLPAVLVEAGFRTSLIIDEPKLLEVECASDFQECNLFEMDGGREVSTQASDVSTTNVGRMFASVAESILHDDAHGKSHAESPRLIWVHSRGMNGPWDAPLEYQQAISDEDAPLVTSIEVPHLTIGAQDDPDLAFRYSVAYAAQVSALDSAWQDLNDAIAAATEEEQAWTVVFLGSRGFSLGEDGLIGGTDSRLTSAQLHVPWLIRFPDDRSKLFRSDALVSHLDLLPTLIELEAVNDASVNCGGSSVISLLYGDTSADRDYHVSVNKMAAAIRTPRWCLRTGKNGAAADDDRANTNQTEGEDSELFVRPDDRWEVNDVSKLCPEVIEELRNAMQSTLRQYSETESDARNQPPRND